MGLVLDELEENEKDQDNVLKVNDVHIVYDRRLKYYINAQNGLKIDFRKDKWGSGFVILGASSC